MSRVLPPLLSGLFPSSALSAAERFLAKAHVSELSFWRFSLSASLTGPNGKANPVFIAIDGSGLYRSASCPCSGAQKKGALCYHLAALALVATQGPDGPAFPVERFKKSLWHLLAGSLESALTGRVSKHERVLVDTRGHVVAALEGEPVPAGWAALLLGFPDSGKPPHLKMVEQHLARLSRTHDEETFNASGVKTRGQAFEESAPFLLSKRAFESFGEDLGPVQLESREDGLFAVMSQDSCRFRMRIMKDVVPALISQFPAFLTDRGFAELPGKGVPTFRLHFGPAGDLHLTPVFIVPSCGVDGVIEAWPDSPGGVMKSGGWLLLPREKQFARLEPGKRPFAEPEAGLQAEMLFDGVYRPSPVGLPLDQETVVPSDLVPRFLKRHGQELASWPTSLLPVELRGGGLGEPEAAELHLLGVEGEKFRIGVTYIVHGRRITATRILSARRLRQQLLFLDGLAIAPQHPRFSWLDLARDEALPGKTDGAFLLAPLEVCRLRSFLPVQQVVVPGPGLSEDALARFEDLSPDTMAPPPEDLGFELFDFQRTGYGWLWFLYRNGFGGLLCDDMGLGKTFQVMALAAAARQQAGGLGRTLVVCPASVLPHWQEKLGAFLPGAEVCTHTGAGRTQDEASRSTIVLTTYGTLRNDIDDFEQVSWDLLVLDEMHVVKNRGTVTHRAMKRLPARVVIGLTGTPIENSVEELRNLLELVLPGYLPSESVFRKDFVRPVEEGDPGAQDRLRRLIRPFVLRRTKQQVLTSLPEKIEDRRVCSMTPGQALLYSDYLEGRAGDLRRGLLSGRTVSYLHVFALLSKLKQICDHPALVQEPGTEPVPSGKWDLFVDLLDEALSSGLKVVVFSQYVRMLDLMGHFLDERGIRFAEIRGATVDRATPVRRFREDPDHRVFLASLNAAGAGIDLSAGSVVIHYDRWWNQAKEDQATDRVHRLGQTRGVQVLNLVTKGTVEERIERLIEKKARLSREVVPEDDAGLLKRFSRDELMDLLSPAGQ